MLTLVLLLGATRDAAADEAVLARLDREHEIARANDRLRRVQNVHLSSRAPEIADASAIMLAA